MHVRSFYSPCLSPLRVPDPGSAWSSPLGGWIHTLRCQASTLLVQSLAHLDWKNHHLSAPGAGEVWKMVPTGWLKGRQDTGAGGQSGTLACDMSVAAGVGTGCSCLTCRAHPLCPLCSGEQMWDVVSAMAWACRSPWAVTLHQCKRDQCRATPTFVDAEPRVLGRDVLP